MTISSLISRMKTFFQGARGRRIAGWSRRILLVLVIGVIAYQFSGIGWGEVLAALPTTPLFYLIFALMYLALPATETLIYRLTWEFKPFDGFLTFIKKRIYNKDVLGYSGEVHLYLWAEKNIDRPRREIIGVVKDNNIVSSVTSTFFAVAVLSVLVLGGIVEIPDRFANNDGLYIVVALLVAASVAALAPRLRKLIFTLPGRTLAILSALHMGRLLLVNVLQVVQWAVVLPEVSLQIWLMMISVQIMATRIPFLPARDLLFIGASVELSRMLEVPPAGIAGMLLAASVLDKILNFLLFSVLSARTWKTDREKVESHSPPVLLLEEKAD